MTTTEIALKDQSLDNLGSLVRREHGLAIEAGESMLVHAIRCGEALNEAKSRVPRGGWGKWLVGNSTLSQGNACLYMKIARKQAELPPDVRTINRARQLIQGKREPDLDREVLTETVREMRAEGMEYRSIASKLGISSTACYRAANLEKAAAWAQGKRRRRQEARAALHRVECESKVKAAKAKAAKPLAKLYATCEKLADEIAAAEDAVVDDREAHMALAYATGHYHKLRDQVVAAVLRAEG